MTKRLRTALAVLAAVALAGCAYTPQRVASPDSSQNLPPAIDDARFDKLLEDTQAFSNAGDAAKDAAKLGARFVDPARLMRHGEYVIAANTRGAQLPALPLTKPQAKVVGQATDWPRYVFSLSPSVANQPLYVFGFVQSQARANYALWGYVKLFPKTKFPTTFKPEIGSPALSAGSKDFVMKPGLVTQSYVTLLNNPNDPLKNQFDTSLDAFWAHLAKIRKDYQGLAARTPGSEASLSVKSGTNGFIALKTTDSGALMMTTVVYDVVTKSPRPLNLSPAAKAFSGKATAGTLTETHTVTLLISVPPAGSADKVKVLGAAEAPTAMSAS